MKYKKSLIAWNPKGDVKVVPWPDTGRHAHGYKMTAGACYSEVDKYTAAEVQAMVMVNFHTLVVRDGIDPQKAHHAFLAIEEYRATISPDIQGADL